MMESFVIFSIWNHPIGPSVDAWLGKMVQLHKRHNCLRFTPIIMKLPTQTPYESMMCPY